MTDVPVISVQHAILAKLIDRNADEETDLNAKLAGKMLAGRLRRKARGYPAND